jgi:LacI family transcriptional regulator, repressor for deo operon, udp, cdd, tsx, nupC, and nupG
VSASIRDVADQAGVSVATVSRALRGLPNVAPSTRNRVLAAAAELRYIPDPNASRLAAGRTRTVGVVVPLFTQWFLTQVVAGAEGVLAAAGYDLLLFNVSGPEARNRFLERMPFRKRVDGLIAIDLPMSAAELEALERAGAPVVVVGIRTDRFPSVNVDNVGAGAAATRHLVNLGHDRIGLIANLPDDPMHFTAPLERRAGYQRVLAEAGAETRPELDVPGNFSLKGGAEAMAQLLSIERPPTAVFAESDEMALGALKTVRDAGLRVPGDMSVIGFDDHDIAGYTGLTTIAQPVMEQGEVAATLLLEEIARGGRDEPPTNVVLPTKLVVRTTTGPPRLRAHAATGHG